jgi:hypothetical protein
MHIGLHFSEHPSTKNAAPSGEKKDAEIPCESISYRGWCLNVYLFSTCFASIRSCVAI